MKAGRMQNKICSEVQSNFRSHSLQHECTTASLPPKERRETTSIKEFRVSCLKFSSTSTLAQIRADDGRDFHNPFLKRNVPELRLYSLS